MFERVRSWLRQVLAGINNHEAKRWLLIVAVLAVLVNLVSLARSLLS